MNLSIIVMLVLSVVALSNLCSAAHMFERRLGNKRSSKLCDLQSGVDTNNCARGSYTNKCRKEVCWKDVGENCGSKENLYHQIQFGMCARGLICCRGTCTDSGCNLSLDDLTGNMDAFMQNQKRKSDIVLAKIPNGQLDDEEY